MIVLPSLCAVACFGGVLLSSHRTITIMRAVFPFPSFILTEVSYWPDTIGDTASIFVPLILKKFGNPLADMMTGYTQSPQVMLWVGC